MDNHWIRNLSACLAMDALLTACNKGTVASTSFAASQRSFSTPQEWSGFFCQNGEVCKVSDVNGDGKVDLIAFNHGIDGGRTGVFVGLSTGTSFGLPLLWSTFFCLSNETCLVGDVNGDGKADIVALTLDPSNHVFVSLSTGTSFGPPLLWSNYFCLGNEVCEVGDVTGSGQADIIAFTQDGSPRAFVSLSTGTSFAPPLLWSVFFCQTGEVCRAADFSGDGKADVVAFNHGIHGGTTAVFVSTSDGTSFGPPHEASPYFCLSNETCEVGDVNGDGKADIIAFTRGTSPRAFVGLSTPRAAWHVGIVENATTPLEHRDKVTAAAFDRDGWHARDRC